MASLEDIFRNQLMFQKKVGLPFSKITSKDVKEKERLSDLYILSMIDELIEFRSCYNKKAWVKKRFRVDRKTLYLELSDIYLFLINLTLLWDLSVDELLKYLQTKQMKNLDRLKNRNV